MTGEAVMAELKQRRLPTFGTAAERRERLRKFHGMSSIPSHFISLDSNGSNFGWNTEQVLSKNEYDGWVWFVPFHV